MTISKLLISKKIVANTNINLNQAKAFTEKFISLLKPRVYSETIKLSGFGTFSIKNTSKRIGRNPNTKESYIIGPRKKT